MVHEHYHPILEEADQILAHPAATTTDLIEVRDMEHVPAWSVIFGVLGVIGWVWCIMIP